MIDILGIEIPDAGPLFLVAVALHIAAGVTAVVAGAAVMLMRKGTRRHSRVGRTYLTALTVIFLTMVVMVAIRWPLNLHLLALGTVSLTAAALGVLIAVADGRTGGTSSRWARRTSRCSPRSTSTTDHSSRSGTCSPAGRSGCCPPPWGHRSSGSPFTGGPTSLGPNVNHGVLRSRRLRSRGIPTIAARPRRRGGRERTRRNPRIQRRDARVGNPRALSAGPWTLGSSRSSEKTTPQPRPPCADSRTGRDPAREVDA